MAFCTFTQDGKKHHLHRWSSHAYWKNDCLPLCTGILCRVCCLFFCYIQIMSAMLHNVAMVFKQLHKNCMRKFSCLLIFCHKMYLNCLIFCLCFRGNKEINISFSQSRDTIWWVLTTDRGKIADSVIEHNLNITLVFNNVWTLFNTVGNNKKLQIMCLLYCGFFCLFTVNLIVVYNTVILKFRNKKIFHLYYCTIFFSFVVKTWTWIIQKRQRT